MWFRIFLISCLVGMAAQAQQGDRGNERQAPLVPDELIPPAPVLTPEEALASFTVQPGFRVEVVASEPLVHDPIAMTFGPDGRIWVVEMRGFMPNVDGEGEREPVGNIVVLEDTTGDGKMDKRTVFLDGLVMPRAVALVQDGVLVAEPPHLWFCKDTTGDGKADHKVEFDGEYGDPRNPEHTSNGLLWALDNWIYSANHLHRFRLFNGSWEKDRTIKHGQWGISQDNYGRLYFNGNSDHLRADLVPSHYLSRNPNYSGATGANIQVARDQSVWPVRVNPGINRGYQTAMLRDGRLARFTAASGLVIYRGDQFPAEFQGNAFVPEPAGNLIRRSVITDEAGVLTARNAYDRAEFLASTDERFRPVNLYNGPDGALYIVDFYRGILQHRIYVTSYLRAQIESRGLDQPIGLGRIYRVVHDGKPAPVVKPALHKASGPELVEALSHPGGWWRDTAQRLLVERGDAANAPLLRKAAVSSPSPFGRLHALYTLDGSGQSDAGTVIEALKDSDPKHRIAALRAAERFLKSGGQDAVLSQVMAMENDTPEVQWQLAFTLGESRDPRAESAMLRLAHRHGGNRYVRDALLSGLGGRELELIERALAESAWQESSPATSAFLQALAGCVYSERNLDRVDRLFAVAAGQSGNLAWRRSALLEGVVASAPSGGGGRNQASRVRYLRFPSEPAGFSKLRETGTRDELVETVASLLAWPGKGDVDETPTAIPLTPRQKRLFDRGRELYAMACVACHQPDGQGQEGLAPPLANTDWAVGPPERLVRILLHGVRGPMTVNKVVYDLEMPGFEFFDDEQIASVLTYIRREWGHTASPVAADAVARIRGETSGRIEAWTEDELLEIAKE